MDYAISLLLLAALALTLMVARLLARNRRKRLAEERERARRKRPRYKPRPMSSRGEMRAYDDPSTLAGEITTRGNPPTTTQNPIATAASNSRPSDAQGRHRGAVPPLPPNGTRSRGGGKPGA
jgi:hypothetical protein